MAFGDILGTGAANGASIGASNNVSISATVSVGDLIVTVLGQQTALTASGASDNLGNTYTAANAGTDAGAASGRMFYSRVTVAGSLTTVTVNATSSANDFSLVAAAFEGPFTDPPIDANPANNTDLATPYTGPATGTLSQADELIISWFGTSAGAGNPYSATAPNVSRIKSERANTSCGIGSWVVSSTSTVTPEWTSASDADTAIGTSSFKKSVAAANPELNFDWPNPVLRVIQRPDWKDSFKLPLQEKLPPGRTINDEWPNPPAFLIARRNPQDWKDSFKLPIQEKLPPGKTINCDWPNPVLPIVRRPDWKDSFKLPIQERLPPGRIYYPQPHDLIAKAFHPVTQRTWTDSFKLPLQQNLPPGETINHDWPNPRGPLPPRQDWVVETNIALLTTVTAAPFFETDWPNPQLRQVLRPDWMLPQPYVLNAPTVNPGFTEWAVPTGLLRPVADWILPQPYVLNVVAANPIVPQDWPVPRGPLRATAYTWTNSFKLPLQQSLPPGSQRLELPVLAKRNPPDFIDTILPWLQAPPIRQTDWPVPKGQPPRPWWTDSFKLPLQQNLPKNQYNWPNPVLARKPVIVDWILSVPSTLTFTQPPLNQHDWPNPSLRKVSLVPTWTDWFKLPLQERMPPRQLDWPNPKGPRQPAISALAYILITQPSPPIPPIYDDRLTLKNEVRRTRDLVNKTGRVRFLKNEIRR